MEAASDWDFGSCMWVQQKSTPEMDAAAKRIEILHSQFPVWKTVTERLTQYISFASEEDQGLLKAAVASMVEKQKLLGRAIQVLGTMVLSSVLVGHERAAQDGKALSDSTKAAYKYVLSVLKVPEDSLPKKLREHVNITTSGTQASGSAAASSAPQLAATSSSATPQEASGAAPAKRVKIMKRAQKS